MRSIRATLGFRIDGNGCSQSGKGRPYLAGGILPMAFKDRAHWFLLTGLAWGPVVKMLIAAGSLAGVVAACESPAVQNAAAPASKPSAPSDPDDPKLAGHFAGRVIGQDDQPIARARLFVVPTEPFPTKSGPVRALTGGDGRFEFDAPDMTFTEIDGLPTQAR
jgi:hypothetical protein